MKEILQKLLGALSGNLPEIPFEVRFWDGKSQRFGNDKPSFLINFKKRHQENLLKGMGFTEGYVTGKIDIEGDFQQLAHL